VSGLLPRSPLPHRLIPTSSRRCTTRYPTTVTPPCSPNVDSSGGRRSPSRREVGPDGRCSSGRLLSSLLRLRRPRGSPLVLCHGGGVCGPTGQPHLGPGATPTKHQYGYWQVDNPILLLTTIQVVLSIALSLHWGVHLLDVKNAFLHDTAASPPVSSTLLVRIWCVG
jgi:hypothetical protein